MAYSDYGGSVYRNGIQVDSCRGDVIDHAVLGSGPVFVMLHKQSLLAVLRDDGDGKENYPTAVDREIFGVWTNGTYNDHTHEFDGYKLRVVHQYEDNCYVYAELREPSGVVWHGFSGYGVGDGFEGDDYGYSTAGRIDSMWELFGKWEEKNGIGRPT